MRLLLTILTVTCWTTSEINAQQGRTENGRNGARVSQIIDVERQLATRALFDAMSNNHIGNTAVAPWSLFESLTVLHAISGEKSSTRKALQDLLSPGGSATPNSSELRHLANSLHAVKWQAPFVLAGNANYGVKVTNRPIGGAFNKEDSIKPGDLIFTVDNQPIRSPREAVREFSFSQGIAKVEGFDLKDGRPFSRNLKLIRKPYLPADTREQLVRSAAMLWIHPQIKSEPHLLTDLQDAWGVDLIQTESLKDTEFQEAWKSHHLKRLGVPTRQSPEIPVDSQFALFNGFGTNLVWRMPFQIVKPGLFVFNGNSKNTFLRKMQFLRYRAGDAVHIVDLDFDDTEIVCRLMMLRGDCRDLALSEKQQIIERAISYKTTEMTTGVVEVIVPEFAFQSHYSIGAKSKLGLHNILTENADYSRLDRNNKIRHGSFQQDVGVAFDSTHFEVTAHTQAVAVAKGTAPQPVFRFLADQPFFFSLQHSNGLVLCTGFVKQVDAIDSGVTR